MDNVGLTHRIVVKAQIWRDGRLLIIKRSPDSDPYPGLWDVPGGSLHKGETIDQGLRRETSEEVDLALSHIRPLTTWSTGQQEDLVIGLSFLATSETDTVTLSEEHTDFAWIEPISVNDYDFPPNLAKEINWVIAKGWHLF
ncbi:NUDIX domain-containing protein [Parvibaculaceae bacterium PLY_AMNH_Bact1]|nr:NUDIX domain-containing protein [Parvibaculaceae bacterium PLY_AMNH_Bact1]